MGRNYYQMYRKHVLIWDYNNGNGKIYSTSKQSKPIKQTGADYTALMVVTLAVPDSLGEVIAVPAKNHLLKAHGLSWNIDFEKNPEKAMG